MSASSQFLQARLLPFSQSTAEWALHDEIPGQGEFVVEIGTPNKVKVGNGIDKFSILPYLSTGTGTPQTLQDTLNLGFSATSSGGNTGKIKLTEGTSYLDLRGDRVHVYDRPSSTIVAGIENNGGIGQLFIKEGGVSPNAAYIRAQPSMVGLAPIFYTPSDAFASGSEIEDTFVTHRTTKLLQIEDSTGADLIQYSEQKVQGVMSGDLQFSLQMSAGVPTLILKDSSSLNYALIKCGVLSSTYDALLPDKTGTQTFAMISDVAAAGNYTYALALDANYTVPGVHMFIELPNISANRNIIMPAATAGAELTVSNINSTLFTWMLAGVTTKIPAGSVATSIPNATGKRFLANGTYWTMVD